MRSDEQGAKKAQRVGNLPTLTEKEKVRPKSPGRELRNDEQCGLGIDPENGAEQTGQRGISWKESDIRNFHHLVINRRNNRLVTAIENVREPVAIVLNQTGVAIGKRTFRCKQ